MENRKIWDAIFLSSITDDFVEAQSLYKSHINMLCRLPRSKRSLRNAGGLGLLLLPKVKQPSLR
jgi:hypothetical protein